jgi:hypothetical protein
MKSLMRLGSLAALVLALAACDDFRSPSEIVEPQLLGVRVVPPSLAPGEEARVEFLIADVNGPLSDVPVAWEVIDGPGGVPAYGEVRATDEGFVYSATSELEGDEVPELAVLQGIFSLPQREVIAVKIVHIGARRDNPQIAHVTIDGAPIAERGRVAPGAEVELHVEADIALEEPTAVTWAATEGELERFLRTPVTWLIPADAAGTAWLYVVVRDGEGGSDWAAFPVDVDS